MSMLFNSKPTKVVGNDYVSDGDAGFKAEVSHAFESYAAKGINLSNDMLGIITNPHERQEFLGTLMESFSNDAMFTNATCANSPFYNNYVERVSALTDNSLNYIAQEAVMQGYAPIVSYNPFFLKKQWVSCVFKDVLMTEVPTSPVINLAYEKRYLKAKDGTRYEIPDVFYDSAKMNELLGKASGLIFNDTSSTGKSKDIVLPAKNLDILTVDYVPGIVVEPGTRAEMLTQDLAICEVTMTCGSADKTIPVDIRADVTTHAFMKGVVSYTDKETGTTYTDEIVGNVDFIAGTINVFSSKDLIKKIKLSGHIANRFNDRVLDTERRVEQIQHVMPESGPRFTTPVTIEEAADALALQKIDVIADNVDIMGRSLGEIEDYEIRKFLIDSFDRQKSAGVAPHGYDPLIVEASFNALPYEGYTHNVSDWMKDSREYFERVIASMKQKLNSPDVIVVAVAHPDLIRFLQNGIDWVFSDDTQVSGMKISYNFGIFTSGQDRVHVITSRYLDPEMGIMFIEIPLTKELITYKHYKYNMVIDRGYRSPTHTLVPAIMATHRTLTFEVLPVQGRMTIGGRGFMSPETLKRAGSKSTVTIDGVVNTQAQP